MTRFVPVKNIEPFFTDIKKPDAYYARLAEFPQKPPVNHIKRLFLIAGLFILLIFGVSGISTILNLKDAKDVFIKKGEVISENFFEALNNFKEFEPKEAIVKLKKNREELKSLNELLNKNRSQVLFSAIGNVVPVVKEADGFLAEINDFNSEFLTLGETLNDLQTNGFGYFQNHGPVLIQKINQIQNSLRQVNGKMESIRNTTANLKGVSELFENFDSIINTQYLKYSSELQLWDKALGSILEIFGSANEKHILLIFQNPAEIRPGGGFIGSYADMTVKNGQLTNLEVQDIYWPDHPINFKLKVVPPEPLQTITEDWGARDANWFFDFPTSAKTVVQFLEASKIYEEKSVKFEGVIGLNINVLKTVLELIGPVPIPEYDLVIDKNNFLIEIQREVETGRDKKPGNNPKKILGVLTPIILERLNHLPDAERNLFAESLKNHLERKDIMIFAKNQGLANLFSEINLNGAVYPLPNNFWGSYLAVVNANIAGGKSDVFINQTISGKIDIDTEGGIFTDLTITREHKGDKEKDPWWRADNKNFIQIFSNPGTNLISIKGNNSRPKNTQTDYKILDYETNLNLEAIESSQTFLNNFQTWVSQAFGKTVFGTWFNTPAGKSNSLNLRYQTQTAKDFQIENGKIYQLIFEKQSGVESALKLTIGAPFGYKWKESKNPIYTYENNELESRTILNLTLEK